MKKWLTYISLILNSCVVSGQIWQNLVPNYSFENVRDNYPVNPQNFQILPVDMLDNDTLNEGNKKRTRKYAQGLILNMYWPAFPSSIGYLFQNLPWV